MPLKIGASVRLNSGGPMMTVQEIEGESATCAWFDKGNKLRTAPFSIQMLNEPAELSELLEELKRQHIEDGAGR